MAALDEIVTRVSKAKTEQVTAATEIWNSRLELLHLAGDMRGLIEHLRTPVEYGDNCGCGNNCTGRPEVVATELMGPR